MRGLFRMTDSGRALTQRPGDVITEQRGDDPALAPRGGQHLGVAGQLVFSPPLAHPRALAVRPASADPRPPRVRQGPDPRHTNPPAPALRRAPRGHGAGGVRSEAKAVRNLKVAGARRGDAPPPPRLLARLGQPARIAGLKHVNRAKL